MGEAASLREAPLPPDSSLPKSGWRSAGYGSSCLVPPAEWVRFHAAYASPRRLTEPPRTCGVGERHIDCFLMRVAGNAGAFVLPCWQVAAALSAAVTIAQPIGGTPNSQAEPTPKSQPTQSPDALRERGSGGEALLSEKRPLPQNLHTPCLFGREREGGASRREAASLAPLHLHV